MKLKPEDITFIENVIRTAAIVHIDSIIIEPDRVRALDENTTVLILEEENIPDFDFNSIGLDRVGVLLSRLNIAKERDNFGINAEMDDNNEFIRVLKMSGKGTKIDFRCSNPNHIRAPKQIQDEAIARVQITKEVVDLMQKGIAAMGAEYVNLISNDEVTFEFVDVNNDVFSHVIADEAEHVNSSSTTKFAHKYPAKTLLALFKNNPDGCFEVGGQKGMLSIKVNNLTFYVLPKV